MFLTLTSHVHPPKKKKYYSGQTDKSLALHNTVFFYVKVSLQRYLLKYYHILLLLLPLDETISWSDGSPLNYSNWGIREPEFDHLKGNFCVSLRTTDGVWQLSPCREKKGFVCKMDAGMCFHERRHSVRLTIVLDVPCCLPICS